MKSTSITALNQELNSLRTKKTEILSKIGSARLDAIEDPDKKQSALDSLEDALYSTEKAIRHTELAMEEAKRRHEIKLLKLKQREEKKAWSDVNKLLLEREKLAKECSKHLDQFIVSFKRLLELSSESYNRAPRALTLLKTSPLCMSRVMHNLSLQLYKNDINIPKHNWFNSKEDIPSLIEEVKSGNRWLLAAKDRGKQKG